MVRCSQADWLQLFDCLHHVHCCIWRSSGAECQIWMPSRALGVFDMNLDTGCPRSWHLWYSTLFKINPHFSLALFRAGDGLFERRKHCLHCSGVKTGFPTGLETNIFEYLNVPRSTHAAHVPARRPQMPHHLTEGLTSTLPPLVVPHPLSFPRGGVGDRHLVNPKIFVAAHCVFV